MKDALADAHRAYNAGEVPVGCVFVYANQVIATGSNQVNETKNATRHAEMICIDLVLDYCQSRGLDWREVFKEITVIVTVEPCIMCAAALIQLNVGEIIYGCPNDRFGGESVLNVFDLLKANVRVRGGVCAGESMDLLKTFYKGENPSAPVPKMRKDQKLTGKSA